MASWILTHMVNYTLNLSTNIIKIANLSSFDAFYLSFSIIFLISNFMISFLIGTLEFDLTFKNSDYLGTLLINCLSKDIVIR